jgi:hypothetical protein
MADHRPAARLQRPGAVPQRAGRATASRSARSISRLALRQVGTSTHSPSTSARSSPRSRAASKARTWARAWATASAVGRQRGVQRRRMLGPHQRLAAVAQPAGVGRLAHRTVGVAVGVGCVHRLDARGARIQHEAAAGVVQFHGVGAALGAQVVGQVLGAQQRGADAHAAGGDLSRVDDTERRLADRQDLGHTRRQAERALVPGDQPVQPAHLLGRRRHRVGHHIGACGHHGGQIDRALGIQRVDAHADQGAGLAPALQHGRSTRARRRAQRRWREVLQVHDQHVGAAAGHLGMAAGIGTRAEQPGAAQVGGKGHRVSFGAGTGPDGNS